MKFISTYMLYVALLLVALAGAAADARLLVGEDVDEHGCKPSTGYTYCKSTDSCERDCPSTTGSDEDSHGCKPSTGYSWCKTTKSCERECPSEPHHGGDDDDDDNHHGHHDHSSASHDTIAAVASFATVALGLALVL